MATRAQAEAAEVSLRAHLAEQPWFAGTDLALSKCGGDSAHLMVLAHGSPEQVRAFADCPAVPRQWQGVPLQFVANDVALGEAPLTTQDYANVAVGVMVLVGTFMVGKIGVDSALAARKEHFDRKGQPPAAVAAKESTMDGVMKVFGVGYGLVLMSQQLPVLYEEAKKLLR